MNAGTTPGLQVQLAVSKPANGTHFVAGEKPVITITVENEAKGQILRDQLAQARLMVAGPMNVVDTVTAVKLLNVSGARDATEHHYADLKPTQTPGSGTWDCSTSTATKFTCTSTTATSGGSDWTCNTAAGTRTCEKAIKPNLAVKDNVLTYTLEAVSNEKPGTYLVGFWAIVTAYPLDQAFVTQEIQIGTATAEKQIVSNCADCHKGPVSGKFYLHHIDRSNLNSPGNWSIDQNPVRNCKTCHNSNGYSSFCGVAGQSPCADANRVADDIVKRVHGVHNGKNLKTAFNIDPTNGNFRHYVNVTFPAGPTGNSRGGSLPTCTKCHVDDSWKAKPSRLACGACHDAVDFATGVIDPPRNLGQPSAGKCTTNNDCLGLNSKATCNADGTCQTALHAGNAQTDDSACKICHSDTGTSPISVKHAAKPFVFKNTITLTMSTPAAGAGKPYAGTETPIVTMVVKDAVTGLPIDHTTIDETYNRLYLFVHGPRSDRKPVLTNAARGVDAYRANARSDAQPTKAPFWDFTGKTGLTVTMDGGAPITVPTAGYTFPTPTDVKAADIVAWLNANATLAAAADVMVVSNRVYIYSKKFGAASSVLVSGDVATLLKYPTALQPATPSSYAYNDVRIRTNPLDVDPQVITPRTTTEIKYQLGSVKDLKPGTYIVFSEGHKASSDPTETALITFQVGTATVDKKVATGCTDCHSDQRMHGLVPFDVDYCGNCHDYERQIAGATGWGASAVGGSNNGYGAGPISRRVHGVHYGRYVNKPLEIHATYGAKYSKLIFPQDIRNCTKCHAESDSWKEKPSRVACLACHDSDAAIAHGTLMTIDPTPAEPYSGDEVESCSACHGKGREFSPDKVHDISSPYEPPYLREP